MQIGTRWLDPGALPVKPNCSYVAETGWFTTSLSLIGACTTPVALFVTGMWMHQKNPFGEDSIKVWLTPLMLMYRSTCLTFNLGTLSAVCQDAVKRRLMSSDEQS